MTDFKAKHTCPRRNEITQQYYEGEDTWAKGTSFAGHEKDKLHHCSYCGSIHPDEFMEKVASGEWVVGPTDKSYKAYCGPAFTEQEMDEYRKRVPVPEGVTMHHDVGKFYYQHLSSEQRNTFIELYNSKQMKVGYPGHFYAVPFFARKQ